MDKKRLFLSIAVMAVSLILFVIFAIIIYSNINEPTALDASVRDLFYNTRGEKYGFVFWFNRIITEFGDLYLIAALMISALIYTKMDYRLFILGFGIVLEVGLNYVLKHSINRERPFEEFRWMVDETSSFPSGHSGAVGYFSLIIPYFFFDTDYKKLIKISVSVGCGLIALSVVVSRLVLGMHYITDVCAGLSLGFLCAGISMLLTLLAKKYNILQKPLINFKKKEDSGN